MIGSRWKRRMGKHRGVVAQIVTFNDAGCKLEIRGRGQNQSHLGDKRFGSLQWPMLMTLYEPEGTLREMIVTIDKEGYVVKTPHVDLTAKVEVPVIEGIREEVTIAETKICKGPWHYKGGKGTALTLDHYSIAKNGPNAGRLASTCNDCLKKQKVWANDHKEPHVQLKPEDKNGVVPVVVEAPVAPTPNKPLRRWRVTVIKEVDVEVEAFDYLDAGVAAGGEVIAINPIR